jgi:protein involved in polysaccharide export with SLBB domain
MTARLLLRVLLAICLVAEARPALGQQTAGAAASVVLKPGDLVRIVVWQKPELSGEFAVTPEGTLAHPLYQDVEVAGIPLTVAKTRLRDFLAQTYTKEPLLTVEPLFRVTVGGEVRQPNLYTVPRGTTVAQAVALAGGVTERGKASAVRVLREGRATTVDLTRPEPATQSEQLVSGDQVIVTRGHNFFRDVLGPFASLTAAVVSVIVVVRQ